MAECCPRGCPDSPINNATECQIAPRRPQRVPHIRPEKPNTPPRHTSTTTQAAPGGLHEDAKTATDSPPTLCR
eukprot:6911990-Pyramimonas_sp.AAC.1